MFPILTTIFGVQIQAYGFFVALGYGAGLCMIAYLANLRGRNVTEFMDLSFLSMASAAIGARLLFIATNFDYFYRFPFDMLDIFRGGYVFYGGFIAAFLANWLFMRWKKIPFWQTLDIAAPGVALGHAIGRIGCFAAGCCHGKACDLPWAVRFNTDQVDPLLRNIPVHPAQLYESLGLFILAGILFTLVKQGKLVAGKVSMLYLMGYAALRAFVEIFRGDARGYLFISWISTSQGIALLLFFCGGIFLVRGFRSNN